MISSHREGHWKWLNYSVCVVHNSLSDRLSQQHCNTRAVVEGECRYIENKVSIEVGVKTRALDDIDADVHIKKQVEGVTSIDVDIVIEASGTDSVDVTSVVD
jgi:hypothetical protein